MNILRKIFHLSPIGIQIYTRKFILKERRFDYQKKFVQFKVKDGDKVLDIGSGGSPFPYATQLVDKYPEKTHHRYEKFKTNQLPFTQADVEKLPFEDKTFDYVYCSHVLEHVANPVQALNEIQRVGKRGFIEVPTKMSDTIFNYTRLGDFHKWYINKVGDKLVFIEYNENELRDTGNKELFFMVHSLLTNSFKRMFHRNRDMFSCFYLWENEIKYIVIDKNGNIISK